MKIWASSRYAGRRASAARLIPSPEQTCPLRARPLQTDQMSGGFVATSGLLALVDSTKPVLDLSLEKFDAIVDAGG